MRVLGIIRQSKKREASESPTTQRMAIEQWAALNGHVIVGWAEDIGVSASVAPDRRRDLGPWLTDPYKLASWELAAAWKVDRVVRSLKHWYGELVPFLEPLGKHVAAVTEGINTATSSALEIAMRVTIAQEELTKLKDRAKNSRARLREGARWHGGVTPYGYKPVRVRGEGVFLEIDEEELTTIHDVIGMLKEGYTVNYCTSWLNREGILTVHDRHAVRMDRAPKGAAWRRTTLQKMLESRCLLGQMTTTGTGDVERDEEGNPRQYGAPLMDRQEWDELQELLVSSKGNGRNYTSRRGVSAPRRQAGSPLLRIAYCNSCGSTMYHRPERGKDCRRYYCSSRAVVGRPHCGAPSFKADILDDIVQELYLEKFGNREIVKVEAVALVDHASKIHELDEQILSLVGGLEKLKPGIAQDMAVARLNTLQAQRDEHAAALDQVQGVKETRTGRTYAQEWAEADDDARTGLLREHGVYVMVQRAEGDLPNFVGIGMGGLEPTYVTITFGDKPGMDGRRTAAAMPVAA